MVDKSKQYGAEDITVLEGLEAVRKRPGMYIGGTGEAGIHHMIWEVVDNAIDEAMAGFATRIEVTLKPDNQVVVRDNGRGIPVDIHKQTKKSALETVMTTLHAGGKFGGKGYKIAAGLHGVGVSVVNALSKKLEAKVWRDKKVYSQIYQQGIVQGPVNFQPSTEKETGTQITFQPDPEIFQDQGFKWKIVLERLRQQAYLTKGVLITARDERKEKTISYSFYFEGGISSHVRYLNRNKNTLHDPIYLDKNVQDTQVEIALQYTDDYNERVQTFANTVHTPDGGTHLTGFRAALTRVINDYARAANIIKEKDTSLSGDDVREGLTAIISVKLKEPQFEGQTKSKLGNPEIRGVVEQVTFEGLNYYLNEHPKEAKKIIEKVMLSLRARLAARAARETVIRKSALEGMTLPGKLADCTEKNPSRSELFIVEGDSAGGSAKQGRDRRFQAILPLKGKILNVERTRLDKMLATEHIKELIIALGAGIGDEFNLNRLRYHRIIIMTDADVDGEHIRTLLLTLFFRHFRQMIEKGYLYIAQPPLYKISAGRNFQYAYSDQERDQIITQLQKTFKASESAEQRQAKIDIQRYKGLGEMDASQLWQTTMNPENRVLLQIKIEDAERADEIFSILMGNEVAPRKRFIQSRAKMVSNLDI